MRYGIANDDTESDHATKGECPLSDGDGDQTRLPVAVLHGRLEGVCSAELRIYNDKSDCPIDCDGESDQEHCTGEKTSLSERIRLSNDASSAIPRLVSKCSCPSGIDVHDTVGHVHKGTLHSTGRP